MSLSATEPRSAMNKELTRIRKLIAEYYGIPVAELVAGGQRKTLLHRRQMAITVAFRSMKCTKSFMAAAFGKKDQSAVTDAINKIDSLRSANYQAQLEYEDLMIMCNNYDKGVNL